MIGVCADSNAQLPALLLRRFGIEVVPVTVRIGEQEYLEGIDIDADEFYSLLAATDGACISTAQPSPGQFALAYEHLAERGATEILSVHSSSGVSGTLNSVRLAARHSPVPVRLVDTGLANLGVGVGCVWAAAEAISRGAGLEEAAAVAESLVPSVGNVFVVVPCDSRTTANSAVTPVPGRPVPVMTLVDGAVTVLGRAASADEIVRVMADRAVNWRCNGVPARLNVALGAAAPELEPLSHQLEAALRSAGNVNEIVRCRIGPSMGALTGPGAVGALFFPC